MHGQSIPLLALNIDPQIQVHNDRTKVLGSAFASDDFLHPFLQNKIAQTETLLSKVARVQCLKAKYHILTFSVNNKLRHLLRSMSSTRQLVLDFCSQFDQRISAFFLQHFHITDPTELLLQQIKLSTSKSGMGLISLTDSAPAAYLASLRNLISEFTLRNNNSHTPTEIMET